MLLTVTALSGLSYCSDQGPQCHGFCSSDATTQDAADDASAPMGFADALGFYPPDAAGDSPTE